MEEENKQLLITDLCTRLPYKLHCRVFRLNGDIKENDDILYGVIGDNVVTLKSDKDECLMYYQVKPFLRPISCMTEEEVDALFNVLKIDEKRGDWLKVNDIGIIRLFTEAGKDFYEIAAAFDYLNSIRVDYRGLIKKGLALEAPEGMYEIK